MKKIPLALSVISLACASLGFAGQNPAFKIKNETSFYIFAKDSGAGCPAVIKPGEEKTSSEYWCGFLACATANYDKEKGCMELNDKKTELTQGGYATWFSIAFGTGECTVPEGNIYQCTWDKGPLHLNYRNVTQTYSAGTNKGQPVTLQRPSKYTKGPAYRGVNISGLEYDGTFLDAMYQHPDTPDIKYFVEQGMNTIRLPIRWEFIVSDTPKDLIESSQPLSSSINTMYLNSVYDTVEKYLSQGVAVILDLHNYMRFCGAGRSIGQANEPTDPVVNQCKLVNSEELTHIWGLIAKHFAKLAEKYPDLLIFELMNEPYTFVNPEPVPGQIIKTQDLFNMEVAAVKKIRTFAKNNYIVLSGNYWDPLHGWVNESPFKDDVPNGTVFTAKNLRAAGVDPGRIIIDMHQYFDHDYSGRNAECIKFNSYNHFKQTMSFVDSSGKDIFAEWMRDNSDKNDGMKVLLGEFGAADNPICKEDLNYMLRYVEEHAYDPNKPKEGGFIGWTAWRANRHGYTGFSPFNYLQNEDYTVYGANGSKDSSQPGTGIVKGPGNGLMLADPVFSFQNYLNKISP